MLFTHQVRHFKVPHIQEFNVRDLYRLATDNDNIKAYLPNPEDGKLINRNFLSQVSIDITLLQILNTFDPEFFPENLKGARNSRNALMKEKHQTIKMNPLLYQMIKASGVHSSSKYKPTRYMLTNV